LDRIKEFISDSSRYSVELIDNGAFSFLAAGITARQQIINRFACRLGRIDRAEGIIDFTDPVCWKVNANDLIKVEITTEADTEELNGRLFVKATVDGESYYIGLVNNFKGFDLVIKELNDSGELDLFIDKVLFNTWEKGLTSIYVGVKIKEKQEVAPEAHLEEISNNIDLTNEDEILYSTNYEILRKLIFSKVASYNFSQWATHIEIQRREDVKNING
jgi:hypothetical protein